MKDVLTPLEHLASLELEEFEDGVIKHGTILCPAFMDMLSSTELWLDGPFIVLSRWVMLSDVLQPKLFDAREKENDVSWGRRPKDEEGYTSLSRSVVLMCEITDGKTSLPMLFLLPYALS